MPNFNLSCYRVRDLVIILDLFLQNDYFLSLIFKLSLLFNVEYSILSKAIFFKLLN